MANLNNPHGFKVWGECLRERMYCIATNPTINFCVGDIALSANVGLATKKLGTLMEVYGGAVPAATGGATYPLLGVITALYDKNMDPVQYIAAATTGDSTVAGYALVADHPFQRFESQTDGTISAANIDLNHEITSASLNAPNTTTGTYLSQQQIAVAGSGATSTIALRLYGQAYPQEDALTVGCRMVCQINPACHYWAAGTAV